MPRPIVLFPAVWSRMIPLVVALVAIPGEVPAQQPANPPVVTEDNDGLPGVAPGPSRKDLEDLIRKVGRDPLSDALLDRVDALFRPRSATNARKFSDVQKNAVDPAFLAMLDAAANAELKTPADTWTLIRLANSYNPTTVESVLRDQIRNDIASQKEGARTIKGQVLDDATGKPIAGAVVSCQSRSLARTDAKGKYTLSVTKPQEGITAFTLSIESPGYSLTQSAASWDEIADPKVMDFKLLQASSFGGQVVDEKGKPIEGVDLVLYMRTDTICRDGSLNRLGLNGAVMFKTQTDAQGNYAFRNIPPDDGPRQAAYNFSVSHPKYQSRRKIYNQNEFLGPGWQVSMEEGYTVRGQVVDEEGKPVKGTTIMAMAQPVTGGYPSATTDNEGKFRIDSLPEGPVQLLVRPTGYVYKREEAKAERGDPAELKITVEKGDFFEGKVVDVNDKPVSGATVGYLQPVNDEGMIQPNQNANMGSPSIRTGADGTFKLGPVAKGKYRVMAIHNSTEGQKNGTLDAASGTKDLVIKMGQGPGL